MSDKIKVNLRHGILVLANDYGGLISPKHENVLIKMPQHKLFSSKIKVRVSMISLDDDHFSTGQASVL
jgi:hypothetical protein